MLPRGRFHSISDDHLIEGRLPASFSDTPSSVQLTSSSPSIVDKALLANAETTTTATADDDVSTQSLKLTRSVLGSNTISGTAAAAVDEANKNSVTTDPWPVQDSSSRRPAKRTRKATLNIHSEHLDIELIKYLYRVYFNKKILGNELVATTKMKRQSNQTATSSPQDQHRYSKEAGECTPKRTASTLLRVTYFDDFDLFRTGPQQQATATTVTGTTENKTLIGAIDPSKINYNKSSSANDLDAFPVPQRAPNKAHSLDKPYHRNSVQPQASTGSDALLSEAAVIPSGAYGVSTACGSNACSSVAATPPHVVSTTSSSTELFETSRSFAEEGYKTPRSRDSSTVSIGLVSCTSKMEDDTIVPEYNDCDNTSAVLKSNLVLGDVSSDASCSSVASSATLRSSLDQQLSDYQSALSPVVTSDCSNAVGTGNKKMTVASSLDNVEPSSGGDKLSASTVKVLLERAPDTSFGICIVGGQVNISGSCKIAGVFIKNIIPSSPAERCNVLQVGDRILSVDDTNLKDASHQYAVSVIKNAGLNIRLVVERFNKWQNDIFNVSEGDDKSVTLDKCHPPPVTPAKTPECIVVQEPPPMNNGGTVGQKKSPAPSPPGQSADVLDAFDGKETVVKIPEDVGESPKAGVASTTTTNNNNFSSDEDSEDDEEDSREMTGRIYTKAGIEKKGPSLTATAPSSAASASKLDVTVVTPVIIAENRSIAGVEPTVPSGPMTKKDTNRIDRASAGNVKLNKMEQAKSEAEEEDEFGYNAFKLRKRYGGLGTVVQHSLPRTTKSGGTMGISLAGHRDRNKMATFIAGINPRGFAANSDLRVGDEILEVNGIVLHGRSHLNASAIIKTLPGPFIKFILLRREPAKALEELAVKPVTQFPIDLDTEADAIGDASFKNVRLLSMTKCGASLGIMIIEGKHSDVGQGIFVSDIQEGSVAERSGLAVGEMILSVNGDSLLNCNYETAAAMLKKTEGVVSLKVCNPNKKEAGQPEAAPEAGQLKVNDDKSTSRLSLDRPASANDNRKSVTLASQPVTPKSHKSSKDLAGSDIVKEITANKECVIEMNAERKLLGLICVGGKDSHIKSGSAVVVAVLKGGAAGKDGRLKVFDQILEVNGVKLTGDKSAEAVQKTMKVINEKITLTVWRADPIETESHEVELTKKSGKDIGVCFGEENGYGVAVTGLLPGSVAEADGRIQRGDIISHVNGDQLANQPIDLCSVMLKTPSGRVSLKILRPKPKAH